MRFRLPVSLSKLASKLPVFAALIVLMSTLSVAAVAIYIANQTLMAQSETSYRAIATYRAKIIEQHFKTAVDEMRLLSSRPTNLGAFHALESAFQQLDKTDLAETIKGYTNPNIARTARREDYDGGLDRSFYGVPHRRHHPILREAKQLFNLYDLFLISTDGTVIYTVEKEADFGTNLVTGPLRDSGLARAFRDALRTTQDRGVAFADFENYAPSNDQPAAFLAQAMHNEAGETVGVLAIQLSIAVVSDKLQASDDRGLDVALVGPDSKLRSQLQSTKENTILTRSVSGEHMKAAAAGTRTVAIGPDADGVEALIAAVPVNVLGKKWVLVASRPIIELREPINALIRTTAGIGVALLLVLVSLAWLMSRRVTGPLAQLSATVGGLARGEQIDIPGQTRKDEIGDLARSLQIVHRTGMDAMRIRSSLDKAAVNLLVADQSNHYVYASGAALKYFQDYASEIQRAYPDFSPDKIVGCTREDMRKYLGIDRVKQTANGTGYAVRSTFGGRTIDLTAVPVMNEKNEYLGATVEWRDVTDDLHTAMEVAGMVNAAAVGDFSQRVPMDGKTGPMREICEGFNTISETVEMSISEISQSLQHLAQGDLTYRMQAQLIGSFEELQTHVQATFERLTETMTTIQATAEEVANAAAEINAGSNDLAKRTEQQATSLEETAATTEQLAASVKQTAESSRRATELAEDASSVAAKGGTIASEAVDAIGRIEKASQQIAEIVGVIDDIAFQTNLLALNAAVEAARAGEAGKGFAVVASEVRTLAQRSGQAAKDIKGLIANSSEQVADGVKLVHGAGEALHQIVDAAARVSATVVDISSATAEQANGIEEMSQTVAQLDEMTQQNSAMAEQSAAAADGLQQQIVTLRSLVATFKTGNATAPARGQPEPKLLQGLVKAAFSEKTAGRGSDDGWNAKAPPRRAAGGGSAGGNWSEF